MRESLQERCDLFIENRGELKLVFPFVSSVITPLCSSLFTLKGLCVDATTIQNCRKVLKENTGLFSNFRGISEAVVISLLALSDNPEEKMHRMIEVHARLRDGVWPSEFLVIAAIVIADLGQPETYEEVVERTKAIYRKMKEAHPFLTTSEDMAFAALLALSDMDAFSIEEETERCYSILMPEFFSKNAVQSLSHVLALGEQPAEEKCERVMALFRYLKERGLKYGTNYELATLGVLALQEVGFEALAQDMIAVDEFLRTQKGFGPFSITAKQRLMYAGILTMYDYTPKFDTMQAAMLNGVVALIIAQQAAMCAAMAASVAASNANH